MRWQTLGTPFRGQQVLTPPGFEQTTSLLVVLIFSAFSWKKSLDDTNKTPLLKNSAEAFIQKRLIAGVREKSQMSGTFDRNSQLTLMFCAGAGDSARNDFRSLRQASSDFWDISVIADMINFISTESTNLFTAFSAATVTSLRSFHE